MLPLRFVPLIGKQIVRHRTRSLLTVAGVAVAMFLFCGVQAMQAGATAATKASASDTTLVVYRKDRYCPFTSRMPESYLDRVKRIPGVASAIPMQITVNNCRTSLDVVTFRGVPQEDFLAEYAPRFRVISGSTDEWKRRSDAALLGETLANRRGLKIGDRFDAAGITVFVAGVIASDDSQSQNVAYVHLPFLQAASGGKLGGTVTQFNVRVTDAALLESVAAAIDAEFAKDQEPTQTRSEKAFVAQAAGDVIELVGFTRWVGWGSLVAVLALVGNAIVLSVQDRVREHAVFQTLGFKSGLLAQLIVAEGTVISLAGGLLGSLLAFALLRWGHYSVSVDGLSIAIAFGPGVFASGLGISVLLGILAGLVPAWQASREEIVTSFRAV